MTKQIDYGTLPPKRRVKLWRLLIVLAPIAVVVLMCSGVQLPIIGKSRSVNAHLRELLGITLPADATVTEAAYELSRDASAYYEIHLPPSSAASFISSIQTAARNRQINIQTEPAPAPGMWLMGKSPRWWLATTAPDYARLNLFGTQGLIIIHSISTGRIYVFWFET